MKPKKSWNEKLAAAAPHQLKRMTVARAGAKKGEVMLLPSARMIDDFIRVLPQGARVSVLEMRRTLARRYRAAVCCPVYTGYHLRTIAEAACEAHRAGAKPDTITPVWRVLDETSPTLRKLARANAALILSRRRSEAV